MLCQVVRMKASYSSFRAVYEHLDQIGAIRNRRNEGARIVGHVKHWTVFAVSNPL